jgi:hypothetical protein
MNKRTIFAIVAVLVAVIVVAGVGIVLFNSKGTTRTVDVAKASSLQFSVDDTVQGVTATYYFAGKMIGASNLTVRVDMPIANSGNYSYLFNFGEQKTWNSTDGGITWTDVSSDVANQWDGCWGPLWTSYVKNLGSWNGTGDYTYISDNELNSMTSGNTIRIYNISVNPTLPDALFQAG